MPKGRAFWLKKTVTDDSKVKSEARRLAKQEESNKKGKREKVIEIKQAAGGKDILLDEKMSVSTLDKKVLEVLSSRGRKGTNPKMILRQLSALAYIARKFGPAKEVPILMNSLSAMFDTLRNIDECMDIPMWKNCLSCLIRVSCRYPLFAPPAHLLPLPPPLLLLLLLSMDVFWRGASCFVTHAHARRCCLARAGVEGGQF